MSNIRSLDDYRRIKGMTIEQRIKELTDYYDAEIDYAFEEIAKLKLRVMELEAEKGEDDESCYRPRPDPLFRFSPGRSGTQ